MSEIICPFCGAENPIEAVACFNCKKQLYDDVDPDASPPPRDEMEWLKDFRGFADDRSAGTIKSAEADQSSETGETTTGDEESDVPEWLARIRALKEDETPAPAEEEPVEPEELPAYLGNEAELLDWIKEIKQGDVPQPLEEAGGDMPEWLKNMAGADELPAAEGITTDLSVISPESGADGGIQLPDIPYDLPGEEPAEGDLGP